MKVHDNFIETYKELESLVREKYDSVRTYEETLQDEDSKKLQLCRIIRNYIQHNSDYESFISISPGMQSFLDDLVYSLHCKNGILKDHMQSIAKFGCLFNETDSVVDAASMLNKKHRKYGIVINKKGEIIGLLTNDVISTAFGLKLLTASTKISKIVDLLDSNYTVKFLPVTTTMDFVHKDLELNSSTIIVAINKAGTFVGFYNV